MEKSRVFLHYDMAKGYDLGDVLRQAKLREYGDQLERIYAPYKAQGKGASEEKIRAAMFKGDPARRVQLTRPIRVVLYYVTATVIPKDKSMHFAEDIYDQDPKLDKALHERRRAS